MRKAIIAVALLGLLAGNVQAKSYNMVGWWQENRTGSTPILFAGAAVDGSTANSNLILWGATPEDPVEQLPSSEWDYETPYSIPSGGHPPFTDGGMVGIKLEDGTFINFVPNGSATNLSKQMEDPAYHPSEFQFTMDIVQWGGGLTGTVTATWSNEDAPLQTYGPSGNEDAIYGVGSVDLETGEFQGDLGLNVVVDIPGIPEDAIVPEPVTMMAAGAGLMGLGGYIRRRRLG